MKHTLGKLDLTTTVGVQYRQDMTKGSELAHTKDRLITLQQVQYGNINELNAAAYLDEVIALSPKLSPNMGLRFDYFRNQYTDLLARPAPIRIAHESIVSPKLNLYYTASKTLQFYFNTDKGFHSNDTRVVVAQHGLQILPPAYGSDVGVTAKLTPHLLVNASAWYLWMAQEFVYVGDEGVVETSGRSKRMGIDVAARYQLSKHLFADINLNTANPRAIGAEPGQNYLPLAPRLTATSGLSVQNAGPWSGSIRYRYMADRPANEDNTLVAKGYTLFDLQANYSRTRYSLGLSVQNLLNTRWRETQFATDSRLKGESHAVNEINFTPGTPFWAKLSLTYFW